MVLEKYDSKEAMEFRGQNAVDGMHGCRLLVERYVKKLTIGEINYNMSEELIKAMDDYVHYRDVAIKYGVDVSGLPRRIRLP